MIDTKCKRSLLLFMLISLVFKLSPSMAMTHSMMSSLMSSSHVSQLNMSEDGHCSMTPLDSLSSKAMVSTDNNEGSCCFDDCQCSTGACVSVYAVMQNVPTMNPMAGNEMVVIASVGSLYILPDFQYRPPKLVHAG